MPGDESDAYRWLDDTSLQVAACFTLVSGVTEQQVLDAFAPDPQRGVHSGFGGPLSNDRWADPFADLLGGSGDEVADLAAEDRRVLWVLDLDDDGHPGWLLVVEDNWFAGIQGEVVQALAAERHVAAFWNVNSMTQLVLAEDGQVLAQEEPSMGPQEPRIARLADGLQLDSALPDWLPWWRSQMVMLERATGIRVTPELLRGLATLVTVPNGPAPTVVVQLEQIPPEPGHGRPLRATPRPGSEGSVVQGSAWPDWHAPPSGWLTAHVAVDHVLGRTDDVVVRLAALAVHPLGAEVELEVARRPGTPDRPLSDAFWQPVDASGRIRPEFLRIDLTYADGRTVSTAAPWSDRQREPDRPVITWRSGGGESFLHRATFWLWPLPPPGPVRVSCSWPAMGIARTVSGLDGDEIVQAAARAERLW